MKMPNVEIPVRVTLRQLYLGELLDVAYSRRVLCLDASNCQKNNNNCQGPGVKRILKLLDSGLIQQVQVRHAHFPLEISVLNGLAATLAL